MTTSLLVSGFDVRELLLPEGAEVLLPPLPLPGHEDFRDAVVHALEEPVDGLPLRKRVKAGAKVTIVIDDFSFPVPRALKDCRGEMLEATLDVLNKCGVTPARVQVLVANGLSRQWRPSELTEWLGPRATTLTAVKCHDAEAQDGLYRLTDSSEGPIEVSKRAVECDLLIHLNLVSQPIMAGTFGLAYGLSGYRTARLCHRPEFFDADQQPLSVGSRWHAAHADVGDKLAARVPVMQVAAVVNDQLWTERIAEILNPEPSGGLPTSLSMWNALPVTVRHRAARVMRASYRPVGVFAGSPAGVEPRARELFLRQHEVTAQGEADVLAFGLPDMGPYSIGSQQNPLLVANLAIGYVAQLTTGKPLVRDGGAIVFANPLHPAFDHKAHRAYHELYEKVLRLEREPEVIHERYEPWLASRPEFVADYRERFAYHGAHALFSWYLATPMRRRASRIIVAYGDPRACVRLGFMGASNLDEALRKAKEAVADASPRVRVLELPPSFFVKVT